MARLNDRCQSPQDRRAFRLSRHGPPIVREPREGKRTACEAGVRDFDNSGVQPCPSLFRRLGDYRVVHVEVNFQDRENVGKYRIFRVFVHFAYAGDLPRHPSQCAKKLTKNRVMPSGEES